MPRCRSSSLRRVSWPLLVTVSDAAAMDAMGSELNAMENPLTESWTVTAG